MKRIFVFCVLALAIAACNKDKVESTPHLKFKSFSSDVVNYNGTLQATLEFTDQEGDLDSVLIMRERINKKGPTSFNFFYDYVPEFGNQNRGELFLTFPGVDQTLDFNQSAIRIDATHNEPDTLMMRFYVKDKAGHVSDTTPAKRLIVIR